VRATTYNTWEDKKKDEPKKLVVSDLFKNQPKANEIPKKLDPPKKLVNPFEKPAGTADALKKDNKETIIQSVK
jgi:hypothetical protein